MEVGVGNAFTPKVSILTAPAPAPAPGPQPLPAYPPACLLNLPPAACPFLLSNISH